LLRQEPAVVAVRQERQTDDRQHPPRRTPAGLHDEHEQQCTEDDVDRREQALPVEEGVVPAAGVPHPHGQHRIQADEQGHPGEHPVRRGRRVGPASAPGQRRRQAYAGAVHEEDQRQYAGEKDDQVVLAALRQRPEHLPEREQRHREGHDGHADGDRAGQRAGRPLLVVVLHGGRGGRLHRCDRRIHCGHIGPGLPRTGARRLTVWHVRDPTTGYRRSAGTRPDRCEHRF
jgi:hypothetical protein